MTTGWIKLEFVFFSNNTALARFKNHANCPDLASKASNIIETTM